MAYVAEKHSDYFRRSIHALGRHDAGLQRLNALIADPADTSVIADLVDEQVKAAGAEAGLRRARRLLLMALMERDLSGAASLDEVCRGMTSLAEHTTRHALAQATAELVEVFGTPRDRDGVPIDLIAVGMGKAGANELNVSSDLDLVFLTRGEGETDGRRADGGDARRGSVAASDFAHRVARRTIALLADTTAEGFVFRVDARLRPNGDSGPLVCGFPALEDYFQVQGREWERFAWLKARVLATSGIADATVAKNDERALTSIVEPFVFRRYLDYDIFAALRELHALIRQEARKRDARRTEGLDVKLGRGGIREVEFIAQLFQIVRGGKDLALRDRATLPTLKSLAERGLLTVEEADHLAQAYGLLRRVEHALQYRDDQQTHFLAAGERATIAAMLHYPPDEFDARLRAACAGVESVFDALLAPAGSNGGNGRNGPGQAASGNGDRGRATATSAQEPATLLADIEDEEIRRHVEALRAGPRYRAARPDARVAIDALLATAISQPVSRACAARLATLLETVCRRPGYLALLVQYPVAFERVLAMLEASEWAARYLTRHPVVLDELIDGHLYDPTDFALWQSQLREAIAATRHGSEPDLEREMNLAREQHHAQVFRVLARDLAGQLTIERVSDELSELADRTLQVAIEAVWWGLKQRFREVPRFAAIAYGRLGGKELGYASDLDLVLLFEDDDPQAAQAYSRLTQRLSTWLSAQTAAGQLFEIDLRLRPNGDAGLPVTSFKAFEEYQRESAWVWEHQALTRARFCAGHAPIGERFESLRRALLAQPRDPSALREEIRSMRKRMHDGHPNRSTLFDLKHDAGGMVDIEFIVQFLVLAHAREHPELLDNAGNIALLGRAGKAALVDASLAGMVADAYRRYRKLQHHQRMAGAEFARVEPAEVAAERGAVTTLWNQVLGPPPTAG